MRKKIFLYYANAIIISILLAATVQASSFLRGDSAGNFIFNSDRAHLSDNTSMSSSFLGLLNALHDSAMAATVSYDSSNSNDHITRGKVIPAAEPGMLLILGLGLMGIALYRRFKIK
jgi:hypothetical protein